MYEAFFELQRAPFGLTPNTEFFYANADHAEALETLSLALRMGEGFIKVTGEVGTGKTLVCRLLLNQLGDDGQFVTAYVPNPMGSDTALLRNIISEYGLEHSSRITSAEALAALNQYLIEQKREGRQPVLVIDEAQVLPRANLETVRLLTNLETEQSKLLQVVLFGQPELDEKLAKPELRQLRQRITFNCSLRPLLPEGIADYLDHRLSAAGYKGAPLFNRRLAKLLHRASGGVPRLINILAHKSLLAAYGQGSKKIKPEHVRNAIADTESANQVGIRGADWLRWFLGALLASAAAVTWALEQGVIA